MFYSHGGGFTTGSGGSGYQDGGNLAKTWDVVSCTPGNHSFARLAAALGG